MSSFWSEMEKLTIKDILGLRTASSNTPSSLPASPQRKEADSDYLAQQDESKPDHTSSLHHVVQSSSILALGLENDLNTGLYPVSDAPQLLSSCSSSSPPKYLRKISKNASVRNLHALASESFSHTWRDQPLPTAIPEEGEEDRKYFTNGHKPRKDSGGDCLPSSSFTADASVGGYRISFTNIFHYFFGGTQSNPSSTSVTDNIATYYTDGTAGRAKVEPVPIFSSPSTTDNIAGYYTAGSSVSENYDLLFSEFDTESFSYPLIRTAGRAKVELVPTVSSPSTTDNMAAYYTAGSSVSENYDDFFSEFDTGSFFYPLLRATDQTEEELVPIFSCSRSTRRNLQFPEAYDHFFASSSSDDSSMESDEEAGDEDRGPIRVVTRFSHEENATPISTDIYDTFFTDGDLGQNLFWKNTFSIRNVHLTGSASNCSSAGPVRQSSCSRSLRGTIQPISALRSEDALVYHLEDMISRQPFRYQELQTAVSHPRLDASLLVPLRQSDMCLVCIAFASWVLKSANPHVGDAWKAVLLANVSALSAIRYLRKCVRVKAAAGDRKTLRHVCQTPHA